MHHETEKLEFKVTLTNGDVYEEMRSLNQDLTFEQCRREFEQRNLDFDESKLSSLGITIPVGNIYTNLGLLVSDQNPYTTKVAAFDDEANTIFKDRQEFSGPIFKQVDDILKYLSLHNNTRSVISGHLRYDYPEYASEAIREALLNAVIHRDYSVSDSNQIRINQSGINIISVGSLLPGIGKDDILNGVSRLRNKNLANLFLRLNLIEAYGTGIGRIFNLYKTSPTNPQIETLTGSFIMTLPNLNESVISFIKNADPSDIRKFYLSADKRMQVFIMNNADINETMRMLV